MVPRAVADLRKTLPNLLIEVDILKIEDAADYLLLGKGELVASSSKLDHSVLAWGRWRGAGSNASCRKRIPWRARRA